MRAIIPCAGFGTRMNMKPDESKEMIRCSDGQPMITYALDLCDRYDLDPLIITRLEKKDLISFLKDDYPILTIKPKGEWMDTVLASKNHWYTDNLLILPDTRFEPTSVINEIRNDLKLGCNYSLALHRVDDPHKWCVVNNYTLFEKNPDFESKTGMFAFGLVGFKKEHGETLFSNLSLSKKCHLDDASFRYLDRFEDITRGPK